MQILLFVSCSFIETLPQYLIGRCTNNMHRCLFFRLNLSSFEWHFIKTNTFNIVDTCWNPWLGFTLNCCGKDCWGSFDFRWHSYDFTHDAGRSVAAPAAYFSWIRHEEFHEALSGSWILTAAWSKLDGISSETILLGRSDPRWQNNQRHFVPIPSFLRITGQLVLPGVFLAPKQATALKQTPTVQQTPSNISAPCA